MKTLIHQRAFASLFNILILFILLIAPTVLFAQTSSKLFTLLSPEHTYVDFENTLEENDTANILLYENFYSGGGVGIGDFNRDGLADLYFTGNQTGDKLYINQGNFQFKDITLAAGILDNGSWSSGVSIVDLNQDGWDDIYICKEMYDNAPNLRTNQLYINNGDLTFTEKAKEYGLADSGRSRQALFFDYDKDGDPDLFLMNAPPVPGKLSNLSWDLLNDPGFSPRLYQNHHQHFTDVTQSAGVLKTGVPNSASVGDFNNDGWLDVYVANDFRAPDFLYINNGNGTFTDKLSTATRHISNFSMGMDVDDINHDGWPDIFVLDMAAEDNFRMKANMSGMNPQAFWQVVKEGGHFQYMFNTFQLNQGNLQFSDIAQLSGTSNTDWSWSVLLADLDNDGWKDLHVTNGILREIRNTDAFLSLSNLVKTAMLDSLKKYPGIVSESVFDMVRAEQILQLFPSEKLHNYAYQNHGDLTFSKKAKEWGLDQKTFSNGSAYADLDNDGDLDLIINNLNEKAHIFRNNANTLYNNHYLRILLTDKKNRSLIGSKIQIEHNGTLQFGQINRVRGMFSSSEFIVHFGLGTNPHINEIEVTWPDGKKTYQHNISGNQLITIERNTAKKPHKSKNTDSGPLFEELTKVINIPYQHHENDFDDFEKQVLLPHKMSQFGPSIAVADVNGDQRQDILVGGAAGSELALFLQQENGTFEAGPLQACWQEDKDFEDLGLLLFDADQDGDQDLYAVSGGNAHAPGHPLYQDRLYFNDGQGLFHKKEGSLPAFFVSGSVVKAADYDLDGDLDLFVGGRHRPHHYPEPESGFILRNEGGTFTDVTKEIAPGLQSLGMVTAALWTDFDNDQDLDLLITGEWMPLLFLENDKGKFKDISETTNLQHTNGWWYSLAQADMDGDGDLDYFAGNLGENYKYKASVQEPFEVYYRDFDQNGSKDIVLSYYNFGNQFPVRGKSCSSQQIPSIRKKFKSYELFASADLEAIYGASNLDAALHYQVYTFANSYLENKGNGKFQRKPLPSPAQLSSINSFLIEDFNHDGHLDVLLAGNLFVSEVETPRNDASVGLLLLGDGKGQWKSISPYTSGFYAPADVKDMQIVNTTKGKRIFCTVNNGEMLIFGLNK
ncbi:VCBS repeat-containing protein [Rapidithrix thailandica]|uniref:VCBS repeat-containing protein n=1 Tax=Rapidithrix thailandica TaxID=413964 RepID=A0AAW9S719_9BACT